MLFLKAFSVTGGDRQTHLRLIKHIYQNKNNYINYKEGRGEGGRKELLQIKIDLRYYLLNVTCGPFLGPDLNKHVKRHEII